jgi:hypothetical protein
MFKERFFGEAKHVNPQEQYQEYRNSGKIPLSIGGRLSDPYSERILRETLGEGYPEMNTGFAFNKDVETSALWDRVHHGTDEAVKVVDGYSDIIFDEKNPVDGINYEDKERTGKALELMREASENEASEKKIKEANKAVGELTGERLGEFEQTLRQRIDLAQQVSGHSFDLSSSTLLSSMEMYLRHSKKFGDGFEEYMVSYYGRNLVDRMTAKDASGKDKEDWKAARKAYDFLKEYPATVQGTLTEYIKAAIAEKIESGKQKLEETVQREIGGDYHSVQSTSREIEFLVARILNPSVPFQYAEQLAQKRSRKYSSYNRSLH